MNTERFCVVKIGEDLYNNWLLNFTGTMSECKAFASLKRFGIVEVLLSPSTSELILIDNKEN